MAHVYKHCVVGHGLTGTAAAKYLAQFGDDVVLVGPSEGNGAHGACYDEGRIYRILDPKESWATLAERSISRYASLAAEADVEFFEESGLLIFGKEDAFIKQTKDVAARMKTPLMHLTPSEIGDRYPWLAVPACTQLGLLQTENAGHMSPRKLTQAQLKLANKHGASYVDQAVTEILQPADGRFIISTEHGEKITAENVLVAAGVYTSLLPVLPERVVMSLTGSQAMFIEVSAETAANLSTMPSMIFEGETDEDCFYLLPPILYPDGSWRLKIGPSYAFAPPLHSSADVDAWFRSGKLDPAFEQKALDAFKAMFPSTAIIGHKALLCVTDNTPTQNAYIDQLAPGWGICTGGNGWAAKSSDEIGLLAAQMMALPSHWGPDPALPRSWFHAVTPKDLLPTQQLETRLARVDNAAHVMANQVVEALTILTNILVARPSIRARPEKITVEMQTNLTTLWGREPSVICGRDMSWVPRHPFVALYADPLHIIIVMPC